MDNLKIAFICVVLFSLSLAIIVLLLTTMNGSPKCSECERLPLWISTNDSIIEVAPGEVTTYILVPTNTQSDTFDYHYERKEIYWTERYETDFGSVKLYRMQLRESGATVPHKSDIRGRVEGQLIAELEGCGGLAVDWLHDHLYWVDSRWGVLEMAALDGNHRRVVYSNNSMITAVAVDPVRRFLFWVEKIKVRNRTHPYSYQIRSSNLRGGNVRTVISSLDWPVEEYRNSIIVDVTVRRIYFLERQSVLSVCDYDGGDGLVIRSGLPFPTSISISSKQLFWMDEEGRVYTMLKQGGDIYQDLSVCEDCTSEKRQSLFGANFYLRAFDPRMQPKLEIQNPEEDCLQNYTAFTEICPCLFGYKAIRKKNLCEEEGFFLASFESYIQGVSLKGSEMTMHFKKYSLFPDFNFHFVKGLLFWFDARNNRIYRSPIFNLGSKSTVALLVKGTEGLAVDWIYDHLYWTNNNANGGCVEVSKLDGSFRQEIITRSSWSKLFSIAVDPMEGLMYLSNWTQGSIEVAGMDGMELQSLTGRGGGGGTLHQPRSLTLYFARGNKVAQQLFWLETDQRSRKSTTILKTCFLLNRVSCQEVFRQERSSRPAGMAVLNSRLYWLDPHNLFSLRLDGRGYPKKTKLSNKHTGATSLRAYHSSVQPEGTNYCQGGCPAGSLCLPSAQQYSQHITRCVKRTFIRHRQYNRLTYDYNKRIYLRS